jgi:hypothetical protein
VLRDHGEEDDSRRYRYIRDGVKLIYAVSVKQCSPDLDRDGVKLIYAGARGMGNVSSETSQLMHPLHP